MSYLSISVFEVFEKGSRVVKAWFLDMTFHHTIFSVTVTNLQACSTTVTKPVSGWSVLDGVHQIKQSDTIYNPGPFIAILMSHCLIVKTTLKR